MSMRAGTRLSTYICTSVALEHVTLHGLVEVMLFYCASVVPTHRAMRSSIVSSSYICYHMQPFMCSKCCMKYPGSYIMHIVRVCAKMNT